jgi:hypothetical protein
MANDRGLVISAILNMIQNNHEWGDFWNGEDLSIYSNEDRTLSNQSSASTNTSTISLNRNSPSYSESRSTSCHAPDKSNIDETLKIPPMKATPTVSSTFLQNAPGLRAAEAYVRPSPRATNGNVLTYLFDLRNCVFTFTLDAETPTSDDTVTEIFLPDYHFPPTNTSVEVSGGKWRIDADDVGGETMQMLRWWHGAGEQKIVVKGAKRNMQAALEPDEDIGYLEQCRRILGNILTFGR